MTAALPTLHHVNIKTTRLREMIDWYGRVTGATVVFESPIGAWLTNDEANHRIAFIAPDGLRDDPEKRRRAGMHHCAFEYGSFEDLAAAYERLRDQGIVPKACLDHGMTISMYYEDPDGNLLELQNDIFGDWARSKEWMRTELPRLDNPLGVFFDPERAIRAYRDGLGFDQLRAGIANGRFDTHWTDDLGIDL